VNETPWTPPRGLDAVFVRRALFVLGVIALALLFVKLKHVLLMLFAAVLVAVLLRAIADPLKARFKLHDRVAMAISVAVVLGVLTLAGVLFANAVSAQLEDLPRTLPQAWEQAKARLVGLPFGKEIVARAEALRAGETVQGGGMEAAKNAAEAARAFFKGLAGGLTDFILVLVGGVYLAIRPRRYRDGFLLLFPRGERPRIADAIDASGGALNRWLLGTLLSMLIIGVMIGLGLWAVGVPSPIALGILAGLGEFVPLLGPAITAVPGLLLALSMGPEAVLWALLVYIGVQQVESNFIVPLIQKRMVNLPPLLTIFSLVVFAALFGPLGVLFAVPLAVVIFVMVKILYVRDVLGEDTPIPGRDKPDSAR